MSVAGLLLAAGGGCGHDRRPVYHPPLLPPAETVTLRGVSGYRIDGVDGLRVDGPFDPFEGGNHVVLTPGSHRIQVTFSDANTQGRNGLQFDFVAGHTYAVSTLSWINNRPRLVDESLPDQPNVAEYP